MLELCSLTYILKKEMCKKYFTSFYVDCVIYSFQIGGVWIQPKTKYTNSNWGHSGQQRHKDTANCPFAFPESFTISIQ